jgi:predicted alpha/beta superfamily hydrolase
MIDVVKGWREPLLRVLLAATCASLLPSSGLHAQSTAAPAERIETFRLKSPIFGNERTIRVLLPAGYRGEDTLYYPALFLNDGFAVFKATAWNAPAIVTRLVAEKKIPEIVLVGIDNGATASPGSIEQRTNEYLPYADKDEPTVPHPQGHRYPQFAIDEVVAAVAKRYRIRTDAAGLALGGSSYGALAALYTVVKRPQVFGRVLLESPSLYVGASAIVKEAAKTHAWPSRVYIGVGTEETGDAALDRTILVAMHGLQALIVRQSPQSKVKLSIGEGDRHESAAWSRRLPEALTFLWSD